MVSVAAPRRRWGPDPSRPHADLASPVQGRLRRRWVDLGRAAAAVSPGKRNPTSLGGRAAGGRQGPPRGWAGAAGSGGGCGEGAGAGGLPAAGGRSPVGGGGGMGQRCSSIVQYKPGERACSVARRHFDGAVEQ
jgi:hypothetical protein